MVEIGLLWLVACGEPVQPAAPPTTHTLTGEAFGTTWNVKWRGAPQPEARAAIESALADVDAKMSTWRDDSEIRRIRDQHGPVEVSAETARVVRAALELAEATEGAFDPTVQPLVELWGIHGARREALPNDEALRAAREQVGWARVQVDLSVPSVEAGGTALDLNAVAKGHGVDRVSQALSALGALDHMVEVGGEVRAHGGGPAGDGWRLGVDRPTPDALPGQSLEAVVSLRNASLATSGNYRNAYEVQGTRVVHTLDPRTGRPHESEVLSASVVAPDCRTADGWATALMVLGQDGLARIEARPELEALLLVGTADGIAARATAGFPGTLRE